MFITDIWRERSLMAEDLQISFGALSQQLWCLCACLWYLIRVPKGKKHNSFGHIFCIFLSKTVILSSFAPFSHYKRPWNQSVCLDRGLQFVWIHSPVWGRRRIGVCPTGVRAPGHGNDRNSRAGDWHRFWLGDWISRYVVG